MCLLTQSGTVNQEEDSAETVCGQEAVDHAQHGSGLTCAGSHGQQGSSLAFHNSLFCCLDCFYLIVTKVQPIFIPQQIVGQIL